MKVKVLTVKQPWASLIVHGIKDIENRSWRTNFRGRVLIHSSAKGDIAKFGCLQPNQRLKVLNTPMSRIGFNDLPFGSIIGSVEIVDCVQNYASVWADKGVYNWVLSNAVLFSEPIPAKGKLSFWDFDGLKEVTIECPECGSREIAIEDYTTAPYPTYLHSCNKCGYVIMESEWEVVST